MRERSFSNQRALCANQVRARMKNAEGSALRYNQRNASVQSKSFHQVFLCADKFWCGKRKKEYRIKE